MLYQHLLLIGIYILTAKFTAIYLTYKYKRIADIYFALLHELAHCKRDFNEAKKTSFISLDNEKHESRADKCAFNWMVNDNYYNGICLKKDYNINKETKYPKAFVVYRLANDKVIKYNSEIYQNITH